ncbi:glycerol acyltransferase [Oceanobacillus arenosus]|uniref:Glycerol acyltransferase n=1 Tax=Oceanobacillus arenosus TaxID=1229153 RepID=A0A3D8PTY8_9BACI|nr:glycerol acyltransferase [Oceanobacillus arenosus]RDW19027.1 glycerol acyltransferase [Oceanobacillus arenosus]
MQKKYGLFFRFNRSLVRMVFPKYHVQLPKTEHEPVVYISHHQNLFGPFVMLNSFPKTVRTWMLHDFLDQQACYKQYADYTFTERFGWNKYLARLIALPISFFIPKLLKSGRGIPVYRGSREILQTFKISVEALMDGNPIAIFPDVDYSDSSSTVTELYDGFLYLEKYYFNKTGKHICFIPTYVSKHLKTIVAGEKIYFRGEIPFKEERKIVLGRMKENLNQLAEKSGDR